MPIRQLRIPVKNINGDDWAELSFLASTHYVCAETFKLTDNHFTAVGGHRVRLFALKKNVHWKIPPGVIQLDIQEVVPNSAPRRETRK
jgi:hypothetical protein